MGDTETVNVHERDMLNVYFWVMLSQSFPEIAIGKYSFVAHFWWLKLNEIQISQKQSISFNFVCPVTFWIWRASQPFSSYCVVSINRVCVYSHSVRCCHECITCQVFQLSTYKQGYRIKLDYGSALAKLFLPLFVFYWDSVMDRRHITCCQKEQTPSLNPSLFTWPLSKLWKGKTQNKSMSIFKKSLDR